MNRPSRLHVDPTTHLPSIVTFDELGQFLSGVVADEDSRHFSESMKQLASHVESIVAALRLHRRRDVMAPLMMDLLTVLRAHRQLVVDLSLTWRTMYEYAAYLQALNNFRVLIGRWLLDGRQHSADLDLTAEDFELIAWRTLGEGLLLLDMYEQCAASAQEPSGDLSTLTGLSEPQVERAMRWWKKLRP